MTSGITLKNVTKSFIRGGAHPGERTFALRGVDLDVEAGELTVVVTKTAYYTFATFYRQDGSVLEGAGSQRGRRVIARALLHEPVYCRLDHAGAEDQAAMRRGQPNFFLPFNRLGINPFTDLFPVTLLAEGTVRGTGGLRLVDEDCATTVSGLFAAGDVATRELICGGFTGGGSHNAAWALSSGTWAGSAAARHAQSLGRSAARRTLLPTGTAGLRPTSSARPVPHAALRAAVQDQVLPYDHNFLRHPDRLIPALRTLDEVWSTARARLRPAEQGLWRGREVSAMTAVARWMYTSALARTESRGMHKRDDLPEQDPRQHHWLTVGGLDSLWTRVESLASTDLAVSAAAS